VFNVIKRWRQPNDDRTGIIQVIFRTRSVTGKHKSPNRSYLAIFGNSGKKFMELNLVTDYLQHLITLYQA